MAAKKSNKTEHVLKLITKNDEASEEEDYFGIPAELPQEDPAPSPAQSAPQEMFVEPVQEVQQEASAATVPVEMSVSAEQPQEPPTLRAFREQENAGAAVYIPLEQGDELVNIAEILAREKLALVMERMKVCKCRTCMNDVLALALNSLPTKYVTTDAGKQYFQRDVYKKQYETDILAALTKACVRVKAAPRH